MERKGILERHCEGAVNRGGLPERAAEQAAPNQ